MLVIQGTTKESQYSIKMFYKIVMAFPTADKSYSNINYLSRSSFSSSCSHFSVPNLAFRERALAIIASTLVI